MWPFRKKENLATKVEDSNVERIPFPDTFAKVTTALRKGTDFDGKPIEPGKKYIYIMGNGMKVVSLGSYK